MNARSVCWTWAAILENAWKGRSFSLCRRNRVTEMYGVKRKTCFTTSINRTLKHCERVPTTEKDMPSTLKLYRPELCSLESAGAYTVVPREPRQEFWIWSPWSDCSMWGSCNPGKKILWMLSREYVAYTGRVVRKDPQMGKFIQYMTRPYISTWAVVRCYEEKICRNWWLMWCDHSAYGHHLEPKSYQDS